MKELPKDIANELFKALSRLEIANDICKSLIDYFDVHERELTEGERCLLRRAKEFVGVK
jgi:hypothetical protein|tara:strand:- start:231 stop:407 length:177 start_codon:yes stop_codon:yes gene_type:complete